MTDASPSKSSVPRLLAPSRETAADEPLQAEIVEKYIALRPALLSYTQRVLRNAAEAEDIVQVTFLRLFDARKKEPVSNLRGWLYRVAHNLAIDHLRRRNKHEEVATEWGLNLSNQKPDISAEQRVIQQQSITTILGRLNEREKYCLLLRAEGLSYDEIATTLGISAKAVSVYLVRGVKKARGNQ